MSRTVSASRRSAPTAPTTPPYKIFIWDTGTTGKNPSTAHLTELAIIEYLPSPGSTQPSHFVSAIRPPTSPSHPKIPRFPSVYASLKSFVTTHTPPNATPLLVAHNASFDAAFLLAELLRNDISLPSDWRFACSLRFARDNLDLPDRPWPRSQQSLAEFFGVHVRAEHHAGEDVKVLRQILRHVQTKVDVEQDDDLQQLLWQQAVPLRAFRDDVSVASDRDTCITDTLSHADRLSSTSSYSASHSSSSSSTTLASRPRAVASAKKRNTHTTATTSTVREYIITNTGRYYHLDAHCYNLRSAKELIPTNTLPNHVTPCPRCVPSDKHQPTEATTHSSAHGKSGSLSYNQSPANPQLSKSAEYITTNTGKLYHLTETCYYLRLAKEKHFVSTVPSHLTPCPRCVGDPPSAAGGLEAWLPVDKFINASTGGTAGKMKGTTYVTTRKGKYFHGEEGCSYLRRAAEKFTVTSVPLDLAPCPKCIDPHKTDFPLPPKAASPNNSYRASARDELRPSSAASGGMAALLHPYGTSFYVTGQGKKFHIDKACRHLQSRDTFKCDPTTAGKDPCRTCALDLFQEWELAGFAKRK